jgi:hypothetical protein
MIVSELKSRSPRKSRIHSLSGHIPRSSHSASQQPVTRTIMSSGSIAASSKLFVLMITSSRGHTSWLRILETIKHPTASISLLLSTIPDIHLATFDHLDPVSSTCLGPTRKYFCRLHIAKWGLKVSLLSRSDRLTPFVLKSCWDAYANSTEEDYIVDLYGVRRKGEGSCLFMRVYQGLDWAGTCVLAGGAQVPERGEHKYCSSAVLRGGRLHGFQVSTSFPWFWPLGSVGISKVAFRRTESIRSLDNGALGQNRSKHGELSSSLVTQWEIATRRSKEMKCSLRIDYSEVCRNFLQVAILNYLRE